jgi:hypothetical protein
MRNFFGESASVATMIDLEFGAVEGDEWLVGGTDDERDGTCDVSRDDGTATRSAISLYRVTHREKTAIAGDSV